MSTKSKKTETGNDSIELLRGGKMIEVKKASDGSKRQILVKRIPFLKSDLIARVWGTILEEMKLYTDLPENEIEELTEDSQIAIFKTGRDLNFFTLQAYQEEMDRTTQGLGKGNQEMVRELMRELAQSEIEKKALEKK